MKYIINNNDIIILPIYCSYYYISYHKKFSKCFIKLDNIEKKKDSFFNINNYIYEC